jgi:hypothetical protein
MDHQNGGQSSAPSEADAGAERRRAYGLANGTKSGHDEGKMAREEADLD